MLLRELSQEISDAAILDQVSQWVQARLTGMPLAYVLGKAVFRGHVYWVKPGVLIPRHETELLVDYAIGVDPEVVLECGVGSGVIGIELGLACSGAQILGWDISELAIEVARENAARHGVTMTLTLGNFFEDDAILQSILSSGKRILVVSNPPYVSEAEYAELDPSVCDFEPRSALVGGVAGLDYYDRLLRLVRPYSTVSLAVEIGYTQQPALTQFLEELGYSSYQFFTDYAGLPRVLVVRSET